MSECECVRVSECVCVCVCVTNAHSFPHTDNCVGRLGSLWKGGVAFALADLATQVLIPRVTAGVTELVTAFTGRHPTRGKE